MRLNKWLLAVVAFACMQPGFAQKISEKKVIKQLKKDIGYLASDKLEGRRTGSAGEKMAADYITAFYTMEGIGGYKDQFLYPFEFTVGRSQGKNTTITINGTELKKDKQAFPLSFSANKNVSGVAMPGVMEDGKIWLTPMFEDEDQAKDAHFNWEKSAFERTEQAIKSGATGVVFSDHYNAK